MSKKKGVSAEEKRVRILQLFHEKKDFFQLKELEKIAPKEKGVIVQAVKDVVQSLVDDGLVDSDKIGTSIYYWAYPSKAINVKKRKLEELEQKSEEVSVKLAKTKEAIKKAKLEREESEERENTLKRIEELKASRDELEGNLKGYRNCDPKVIEQLKTDIQKAKEAANRWTDNIYAVKSWCKNKFMIEESAIDKQFSIPSDLDYVE